MGHPVLEMNFFTPRHHGCQKAIARLLESYVFGPSGFRTMAPLRCAAKFDPFLSLDCARVGGRGGANFAIWQPCRHLPEKIDFGSRGLLVVGVVGLPSSEEGQTVIGCCVGGHVDVVVVAVVAAALRREALAADPAKLSWKIG